MSAASIFRTQNLSWWVKSRSTRPNYERLSGQKVADVVVVGGGITGLSTAMRLRKAGKKVAVVEAAKIGSGVTGFSTAKISSLHSLCYDTLLSKMGEAVAKTYADMNEAGLRQIADWVKQLNMDCDFHWAPNYTYTVNERNVPSIQREVEAAKKAGLKASFTTEVDLPFPVVGAIRVEDQAQFNSYAFCLSMAKELEALGVPIYEDSRVIAVSKMSPHRIETEAGQINAEHVVLATHLPILDIGSQFAFCSPHRSYLMACTLTDPSKMPQGMYITMEGGVETRTIRNADDGKTLIVGGSGHHNGDDPDNDSRVRYQQIEEFARKYWPIKEIVARWSAMDYTPADNLPYIGYLLRGTSTMFTATGFKKWGIAMGAASGMLISDMITKTPNAWEETVDARRWDLSKSAMNLVKIQMEVGEHFIKDRIKHFFSREDVKDLDKDEGGICKKDGKTVAAYRDSEGNLHAFVPRCTHLGCHVEWNSADRSWDCPCHGSRFNYQGEVTHGPAVKNLKSIEW